MGSLKKFLYTEIHLPHTQLTRFVPFLKASKNVKKALPPVIASGLIILSFGAYAAYKGIGPFQKPSSTMEQTGELEMGEGNGEGTQPLGDTKEANGKEGASDAAQLREVKNFSAKPGDGQVTLTWNNPTYPHFVGTKILRDGVQVYAGSGTKCVDTGLVNGKTYHYKAITYDKDSNYSLGVELKATPRKTFKARAHYDSVVFNNKIWVLGGDGMGSARNDVWYSTDGVNWVEATSSAPWLPRYYHRTVAFKNKMWIMGGNDNSGNTRFDDVWYSTNGVNWIQATSSAGWGPKGNFSLLTFNNKMWVIGGHNQSGSDTNDVWYSTNGVNWIQATSSASWSERLGSRAVVFNNKMWVMGGIVQDGATPLNDVWYSTDGVNWTQATSSAGWVTRNDHVVLAFNNKMWVMGGQIPDALGERANDVWYSTNGVNWTRAAQGVAWQKRNLFTGFIFKSKMWVMGGYGTGGTILKDLWYSSNGLDWFKP